MCEELPGRLSLAKEGRDVESGQPDLPAGQSHVDLMGGQLFDDAVVAVLGRDVDGRVTGFVLVLGRGSRAEKTAHHISAIYIIRRLGSKLAYIHRYQLSFEPILPSKPSSYGAYPFLTVCIIYSKVPYSASSQPEQVHTHVVHTHVVCKYVKKCPGIQCNVLGYLHTTL